MDFKALLKFALTAQALNRNSYNVYVRGVRMPTAFQPSELPGLDVALMRSGVPWRYIVRENQYSDGDPLSPHYDAIGRVLNLLPLDFYPDKHGYTWSLAHELSHASSRFNPNNTRPGIDFNGARPKPQPGWSREIEEAQTDLSAWLVLQQLGGLREDSDSERAAQYVSGWLQHGAPSSWERKLMADWAGPELTFDISKRDALETAARYAKESSDWILSLAK